MAFTFGFYNSLNGDRKYNTEQISAIFDGLIKDGVFVSQGDIFAVVPGNGMQVLVKTGRAWFRHTWNFNDSIMPLNLQPAHVTLSRYDAVVLEIDSDLANRTNKIKIISGTSATLPVKPIMKNTLTLLQVPLAYILVKPAVSEILQADIQFVVGTHECPFVLGVVEGVNVDALIAQWDSEFNIWWDEIKATLDDNIVTNLQNQINQRLKISDKATVEDVEAGTNDTKYMTPAKTKKALAGITKTNVGDILTSVNNLEIISKGQFLKCDGRSVNNVGYKELIDKVGAHLAYPSNAILYPKAKTTSVTRTYGPYAVGAAATIETGFPFIETIVSNDDGSILAGYTIIFSGSHTGYPGNQWSISRNYFRLCVSFDNGVSWVVDTNTNNISGTDNNLPAIIIEDNYIYVWDVMLGVYNSRGTVLSFLVNKDAKTLSYLGKHTYSNYDYTGILKTFGKILDRTLVQTSHSSSDNRINFMLMGNFGEITILGSTGYPQNAWSDGEYAYISTSTNQIWKTQNFITYTQVTWSGSASPNNLSFLFNFEDYTYFSQSTTLWRIGKDMIFINIGTLPTNMSTQKYPIVSVFKNDLIYLSRNLTKPILVANIQDLTKWSNLNDTALTDNIISGVSQKGYISGKFTRTPSASYTPTTNTEISYYISFSGNLPTDFKVTETKEFYFYDWQIYNIKLPEDQTKMNGVIKPVMYIKAQEASI